MKKNIRSLSLVLMAIMLLFPNIAFAESDSVIRLSGPNRVETSIEVSKTVYPGKTDNVVLAGFRGEVDALTGTLLATNKQAPLLLVNPAESQFNATLREIERLDAKNIFLLGGELVINKDVEQKLKQEGYQVERIYGSGRHETAVEVARAVMTKADHVFLTNDGRSGSLADALSVGPVSGRDQIPILLTEKDTLPPHTLAAMESLGVKKVTIVGGEIVVSESVANFLRTKGITVDRIAGRNRYETAKAIADKYFVAPKGAILANDGRKSFADGLVGGYLGAHKNIPILLTMDLQLNTYTEDYIKAHSDYVYILGGTIVVSDMVADTIKSLLSTDPLEVHYIDVGQGDSILIKKGQKAMLIDAGDNGYGTLVVNYLKNQGVKRLDYVIGTHPHSDHIGGLDDVINSFDIGKVIMPNVLHTTKTFEDVLLAIKNKNLTITTPKVGDKYDLGGAQFTILGPNSLKYSNLNNYSVALRLVNGANSFMFTGDAEALAENEIVASGLNLKSDLLKVGHHGSNTSTSDVFLNKVNPKFAVIPVGTGNRYDHPDRSVIDKLTAKGIKIYRNDINGTIIATSDGETLQIRAEKE